MNVSVIIPTFNAENTISALIRRILEQSVPAEIIIADSSSDDRTLSMLEEFGDRIRTIRIERKNFDHGGTRDLALRDSSGDYVLFLTQDAFPTDNKYIEKLLQPFDDEKVAAVFGRQIPYPDAPEYEKLSRQFNYPPQSRKWGEQDIPHLGIRAYFFSDVCSAYRRSAYEAVGGFDRPVETNEDMLMAAKLLGCGYMLVYNSTAEVFHSHRFSLSQDFRRSACTSALMKKYKTRLSGADTTAEGIKYTGYVIKELLKKKRPFQAAVFISHAAARFLGNQSGKYRR